MHISFQFQRRKYSKLKWFRCGKKGYGLQALEDMPQGQFLIEYVGEVMHYINFYDLTLLIFRSFT